MLYVKQLLLGPMQNFVYLVGAKDARETAVIDPAWDVPAILAAAEADGRELTCAILTHHHHDHINGVAPLRAERPNLRVFAQHAEVEFSSALRELEVEGVAPGGEVRVGALPVTCIHTPGHTPGAHCLLCAGTLLTGDTLFIDGCGRCDLPGGDPAVMFESLHGTLGKLPGDTVVLPGHDYAPVRTSTLERERTSNPYLLRTDKAEFVRYRMRPR